MKKAKLYSIGLTALMMFAVPKQTFAQLADFYSSPGYSNYINNLIANSIWNSSMERYTKMNKGSSGVSRSATSGQTSRAEEVPVTPSS